MADENLEETVSALVTKHMDAKITALRSDMQMELAPLRIQLQSHAEQMAEIRKSGAKTAESVARLDGVVEASEENRKANHAENISRFDVYGDKLDALLERFNTNMGMARGRDQLVTEQVQDVDRRHGRIRDWLRVLLNASILGAIYKGATAAWDHLLHHR